MFIFIYIYIYKYIYIYTYREGEREKKRGPRLLCGLTLLLLLLCFTAFLYFTTGTGASGEEWRAAPGRDGHPALLRSRRRRPGLV